MTTTKYDKAVPVCFSGHRHIPSHKQMEVKRQIRKAIAEAYGRGIRNFYCGMALGFDTLAAIAALSLQCEFPDLLVIAVVPFRGQADRWSEKERERYKNLLGIMDEVIVLSEEYHSGCLLRRRSASGRLPKQERLDACAFVGRDCLFRRQPERWHVLHMPQSQASGAAYY